MPNVTAPALQYPARAFTGGSAGTPSGVAGEFLVSQLMAKYSTLVKTGKVQIAYATLTAPVIFSTAAATGGPFIWNKPQSNVEAHILGVGLAGVVASAAAGAIGLTSGTSLAPTAVTAIDAVGNAYVGGPASQMATIGRVATPSAPGVTFMPLFTVGTTALGAQFIPTWMELDGAMVCSPGSFVSIAASATLTTAQISVALVWAELPV